ncbi:hypothetical protein B0H19DRAFT_1293827 [Mycena capillaripes]|nr:hypothetical protein B0H19DRAFT_1293827 [Mycena capillaripes]
MEDRRHLMANVRQVRATHSVIEWCACRFLSSPTIISARPRSKYSYGGNRWVSVSPYFWDDNEGQRQIHPLVDSASVYDDPHLFTNSLADYADPAVFCTQPAQPLDLLLDLFPFHPELSTAGIPALTHQPSGPTQWDEHAVQPRWGDFSSSFNLAWHAPRPLVLVQGIYLVTASGKIQRFPLFSTVWSSNPSIDLLMADVSDGYPSSPFSSALATIEQY